MFKIALFIFVLILVADLSMAGEIYKWVDKDGVIHFTDTPTDPKFQKDEDTGYSDNWPVAEEKKCYPPHPHSISGGKGIYDYNEIREFQKCMKEGGERVPPLPHK